uniref:helix-turn-helix domain-containing protein n=1 Tax=Stappia sp. TaxID=1870903 RepID=UPI003BA94D97
MLYLAMAETTPKNRRHEVFIYEWRRRLGVTVSRLAEEAGIDQGTLSSLESGKRRLNLDHIFGIARALGIKPYQLFLPPDDESLALEARLRDLPADVQRQAMRILDALSSSDAA